MSSIWNTKRFSFLFVFVVMGLFALVGGWTPPAVAEDVHANPGDTDPMDDTMLFQDDELVLGHYQGGPSVNPDRALMIPTDDALTSWDDMYEGGYGTGIYDDEPVGEMAAGRIAYPDRDILVYALLNPDDATTYVELYDMKIYPYTIRRLTLRGPKNVTNPPDQRYISLAVGDLDRMVDENGAYHDEIIVVRSALYANNGEGVMVDVLDYNFKILASCDFAGSYRNVDVILGDFNGDLAKEIAIAMVKPESAGDNFIVKTGRLNYDDQSRTYALAFNSTSSDLYWSGYAVDLACGDFRGKGTQQIIASGGRKFYVFETDANLALTLKTTSDLDDYYGSSGDTKTKVRLAAGLFHFDPSNGYDFNRRQLAAVGLKRDKDDLWIKITTFDMDANYNLVMKAEKNETIDDNKRDFKQFDLSLSAGNFVGHGTSGEENNPAMQLAMAGSAFKTLDDDKNHYFWRVYTVSSDLKTVTKTAGEKLSDIARYRIYFAMPYDFDGDTWRLGPPMQVVMDKIIKLEGMIEEPPKHVDWLPKDPQHPEGEWEAVNIGGYDEFNVETTFSDGSSLESTTKNTSSYEIAGAASLDAKASITSKVPFICKTTIGMGGELGLGYQYDQSTADTNSEYVEVEAKVERATNRDDNIGGRIQHVDVWLYPIYGLMTGNSEAPYGYYQVIVPGTPDPHVPDTFQTTGFTEFDEYQPIHENHNIFSYPDYTAYQARKIPWPTDVGEFTVTDIYGEEYKYQEVFNLGNMGPFPYAANGQKVELTFSDTRSEENEREYNNTFTENAALTFTLSGKIKLPEHTKVEYESDVKLSFDANQSWGGSTIGKQESKKAGGLTIQLPVNPEDNRSYKFMTAVYTSANGGTFRVAHAVDPLGVDVSHDFWTRYYGGGKTDPALNLPRRMKWRDKDVNHFYEWWEPNEDFDKNYMRGFFLREGELNPVSKDYEYLSGSIYDGDKVLLCARVYNYALYGDTGAFNVRFYYCLFDNSSGNMAPGWTWRTQPDMTYRIGDTSTDPQNLPLVGTKEPNGESMREVRVPWDTTGLSQVAKSCYGYRFMVCLDEENEVDEIHEGWKDDKRTEQMPGGNNVGTYPVSNIIHVLAKDEAQTAAVSSMNLPEWAESWVSQNANGPLSVATSGDHDADVSLSDEALSIKTSGGLKSDGSISVKKGKKVQLRAHIQTQAQHPHSFFTLFYDGDPKAGGKLIAMKIARDLPRGDSYIWATWVPEATGSHQIYAHILGDMRYADNENKWETINVTVTDDKDGDHSDDGGCFIRTAGSGR
ncbi:MAG: hypothetical protein AB1724_16805 [Thermodesulfobacteriota bacterium]